MKNRNRNRTKSLRGRCEIEIASLRRSAPGTTKAHARSKDADIPRQALLDMGVLSLLGTGRLKIDQGRIRRIKASELAEYIRSKGPRNNAEVVNNDNAKSSFESQRVLRRMCAVTIQCLRKKAEIGNYYDSGNKKTEAPRKALFDLGIMSRTDNGKLRVDQERIRRITGQQLAEYIESGNSRVLQSPEAPTQPGRMTASNNDAGVVYAFLESLAIRSARLASVVKPGDKTPESQLVGLCQQLKDKCSNQDAAVALVAPFIDRCLTNTESGIFHISNPFKEVK